MFTVDTLTLVANVTVYVAVLLNRIELPAVFVAVAGPLMAGDQFADVVQPEVAVPVQVYVVGIR